NFGGGGKTRETVRCAHRATRRRSKPLAELADEICEIVRNGLTQRIVVNRAESASEIGRALLSGLAVRSRRLSGAPVMFGLLRLASLFGTQPLVPLARVTGARHTSLHPERNGVRSIGPALIHFGPAAPGVSHACSEPGPATETKWLLLCSSDESH